MSGYTGEEVKTALDVAEIAIRERAASAKFPNARAFAEQQIAVIQAMRKTMAVILLEERGVRKISSDEFLKQIHALFGFPSQTAPEETER